MELYLTVGATCKRLEEGVSEAFAGNLGQEVSEAGLFQPIASTSLAIKSASASPLKKYAELLRSSYCTHQPFPPDEWPPRLNDVFVNLALIQHDDASLDAFEKTTLHGTVDDLCFRKYNIKF